MTKKKQIYWFEKGIMKSYVSPSISQVKRVKASAKQRGATDFSKIMPIGEPAPMAALKRMEMVVK
jgi:hypothetical protein